MCLIVSKIKGIELPKDEYLRNAAESNKDGIGVAFHKDGTNEVLIKKDFPNVFAFIGWLHTNITINDSLIIHFRMATSGLVDEGNRHPFPITKNKELLRETNLVCQSAVAHNGVLTEYGRNTTYSDSQKFVLDILSDDCIKNNLSNPAVQKLLISFLSRDRLAIMLSDGTQILLGDFNLTEGINYSAYSYKWSWKKLYNGSEVSNVYDITKNWDWCEGCLTSKEDVREIKYKKAKLKLCKPCRKDLVLGKLNTLLEEKINGKDKNNIDLLSYSNTIKCTKCTTFVNKTTAYTPTYGVYFCAECVKKEGLLKCDTCGLEIKASEMVPNDNYLVCKECDTELKKLENPIVQATQNLE